MSERDVKKLSVVGSFGSKPTVTLRAVGRWKFQGIISMTLTPKQAAQMVSEVLALGIVKLSAKECR